jgi:uncharacterized membrane protein YdfJ with MMPL/SSD domain
VSVVVAIVVVVIVAVVVVVVVVFHHYFFHVSFHVVVLGPHQSEIQIVIMSEKEKNLVFSSEIMNEK